MADTKDDHRAADDKRDSGDTQRAAYLRRYFPVEHEEKLASPEKLTS